MSKELAEAVLDSLISGGERLSPIGEPENITDVVGRLASAIERGTGNTGSLAELSMAINEGASKVALAIHDLAEAIRERN